MSSIITEVIDAPSAGAHTYTVNVWRVTGSDLNNGASATQPSELTVTDVGPTSPV